MSNRGDRDGEDESVAFARALQRALAESEPPRVVAPPPPAELAIVVIKGRSLGRVFPLSGTQPLTVGRARSCSIALDDDGISRLHMSITPTPEGWMAQDERSSGGSFLNGKRFARVVLQLDDKLMIGSGAVLAVRRADDKALPEVERDRLTGLLNRKAFVDALKASYAAALSTSEPLTVALTNLDHFMRFNDEKGHVAGDAALCIVAEFLRRSVPAPNAIGRFSGDGFAICMPRTTLVEARALLEPLRARVGLMHLFRHGGKNRALTMSIGLACVPDATVATESLKALVARADEQLYDAKRNGRDRLRPIV